MTKLATENIYKEIKHTLRREQFSYLPPFKNALFSLGLKYSVFERIAVLAKKSGDYDFVILDVESVFDEEKANLLSVADKVLVITNQTKKAVYATNVLVSNINGMNGEKYIFICNDFKKELRNELVDSEQVTHFMISEYIEHFHEYETMKLEDFAKSSGMKKAAFLII